MLIKKKSDKEEVINFTSERRKRGRTFEDLKEQLLSPSASDRRWAARDLAQYPEASQFLLERLEKEKDVSVREVILSSLLVIRDEMVLKGLVEFLKSDDAHLRNEVIETLKQMSEEVVPYVEALIKSPDPDLRIFAINIMESLRHPKVMQWLMEILEKDENLNVCGTALDLIAELATEEFLPSIRKVKVRFKDEPYIQFITDLVIKRVYANKMCSE